MKSLVDENLSRRVVVCLLDAYSENKLIDELALLLRTLNA